MIATGLIFLFGVLLTALLSLLVLPIVWRKAQALARRDYEATIPTSANEIRAEFDKVRADAAVTIRRSEVLVAAAREKTARSQAELGRATVENVELLKRNRNVAEKVKEGEDALAQLRASSAFRDEEHALLVKQLADAEHEGDLVAEELEALGKRFEELGDIAEERKIQLVAAEAKIDRLGDQLRSSERATRDAKSTIERLRADAAVNERSTTHERGTVAMLNDRISTLLAGIADRDEEILRLQEQLDAAAAEAARVPAGIAATPVAAPQVNAKADRPASSGQQRLRESLARKTGTLAPEDSADIRERISEMAARVIRMSSLAEGVDSVTARLVAPAPGDAVRDGSLADRVRRLAADDANAEDTSGSGTPKAAKAATS